MPWRRANLLAAPLVVAALLAAPSGAAAVPTYTTSGKGTIEIPIACRANAILAVDPNLIYSSLCRGRVSLTIRTGSYRGVGAGAGRFSLGPGVKGLMRVNLTLNAWAALHFDGALRASVRVRNLGGSGKPVAPKLVMLRKPQK